jgi:hypothetical protein
MVTYRYFKVKIYHAQINRPQIKSYTSKVVQLCEVGSVSNVIINPWFLTGFTDGEGSFIIYIKRNKNLKVGWNLELRFQIGLHKKDKYLLDQIKNYLGVGKIYKDRSHYFKFIVTSKDLQVVIEHFEKYPLITQKLADYNLFKQAYNIILNKEHLTLEGLNRLVSIKGSLNHGLSPLLKSAFPDSISTNRPLVSKDAQNIPDPN